MKRVIVPFFISHQGCPHDCIFCDQRTISGNQGTIPSSEEIVTRVCDWLKTSRGRPLEAAFYGGTFTMLPRDVMSSLLDPLQKFAMDGVLSGIRVSTRPDAVNPELLSWLSSKGVKTVELGIQSMDDRVLSLSRRGHTARHSHEAIGMIRSSGMNAGVQLMPGLPGDLPDISLMSLRKCIKAGASFLRFYPVAVIRGTQLERAFMSGEYSPPDIADSVSTCSRMLLAAIASDIPVVRIGLQATDLLSGGQVVAGAYHPAFGELVWTELYSRFFSSCLHLLGDAGRIGIDLSPMDRSRIGSLKHGSLESFARRPVIVEYLHIDRCLPSGSMRINILDGVHSGSNVTKSIKEFARCVDEKGIAAVPEDAA